MAENPEVLNLNVPGTPPMPNTATTPVTEPMINVEVQDRLLRELKRRLFPSDVEGILYSAIVGDLYWQDQLWSLMVDTWPRLQTNLGKLKQAVSSMEYAVKPFTVADDEPTDSALEKADFVKAALFGMHCDVAWQEHDFKETLEDIVDSLIAGFTVMEVYWETRDGGIVPQCSRWLPARYYRYPYVLDDTDRLMLNPSGMLGGTQLVDFPPYKFLVCIKQSHANHPIFTSPMRCLTAWWIASRFGLEWMMSYAQLFGIPQRIAYYQPGDDVVYQKLVQMMRASATATWGVYPVNTKVEVLGTAGSSAANMPQERLVEEADKVCDIMLLGQTLTTEVRESGGNRALGTVHRAVMDEVMTAAAKYAAKLITSQIVPGIVQYNFGDKTELPALEPVVSTPVDLFNTAQALKIIGVDMKVPLLAKQVYERIEFTQPQEGDDVYEPPAAPAPAMPFGAPQAQPDGAKPEPAGAPNGNQPAALKPNIVERVGAGDGGRDDRLESANGEGLLTDPDDDVDPDDAPVLAAARKVSFALDYGEEPEPGEVLRFVEARHEHRHQKTGRFIPTPKAPKRKVGVKRAEPMPEVGLMCKRNEDMGDAKVCQACKEISEEGWIPVDEEYLGYSMNPPHHPNCRCSNEYKTQYRGVDILHQTKSGNPHHHPETGRFVSKPGRKVRAAFDPSEARDEEGKWTSEGGGAAAELKKKVEKPDFSWIQDPEKRKEAERDYKEYLKVEKQLAKSKKIREAEWKIDDSFKNVKNADALSAKYDEIYSAKLTIDPDAVNSADTAAKLAAMQKVPLGMHEQLDKFGTNIVIGDKRTNEYPPANTFEGKPRGYQEGETYAMVPAMYSSGAKTAIIGNPQGLKPEDGVLHELGHAVDHMYDWYSHRSPAIEKAWNELNDRLTDSEKKYEFRYYVGQETKNANLDESFAESFKDYHKYGAASCTRKWGKGFTDVHASMDNQAQYNHDANEAEKAGIESNWPQHEKIQY